MSAVFDARSGLAVPAPERPHGQGRADAAPEAISVTDLTVADPNGRPVLDGLTLTVRAGERVGVVGESGSGKTTLALALLGALRPGLRTAGGGVRVAGEDPLALRGRDLRRLRRHTVAYLPQDPAAALTPTMRVGALVSELAVRRTPRTRPAPCAAWACPTAGTSCVVSRTNCPADSSSALPSAGCSRPDPPPSSWTSRRRDSTCSPSAWSSTKWPAWPPSGT